MKRIYLLLVFVLSLSINSWAQEKWEAGLFLGGSTYFGDLVHSDYIPYLDQTRFAFGVNGRYLINQNFSVQLGFLHSGLKGDDAVRAQNGTGVPGRNISFESGVNQIGATFRWEPFGHKRYDAQNNFKRIVSPYIFAGLGYEFVNATPDYTKAQGNYVGLTQNDNNQLADNGSNLSFPFGGGIRHDLSEKVGLDLELTVNRAFSDFLDGVSNAGNPDNTDWYLAGGLRVSVKLGGPKDSDKDGIPDDMDTCPDIAGKDSAQGCPDSDGDGVEDSKDDCPDMAGGLAMGGCPDADGDGVRDIDDPCPGEKGGPNGCPDSDEDGIADNIEKEIGTDPNNPDTDGDGLLDGQENKNGNASIDPGESNPLDPCDPDKNAENCDMDKDGIVNSKDDCPTVFGEAIFKGCPDSDGDGVEDKVDKCPNEVGPVSNQGCPELEEEEQEVMDLAIQNIHFEYAKDVLKASSIPTLEKIATIMKKYPHYSLQIIGHTDSRGHREDNQKLSEKRAKRCLDWLVEKGIQKVRLESKGYGESVPIADNINEAGRSKNRRVEFILFIR